MKQDPFDWHIIRASVLAVVVSTSGAGALADVEITEGTNISVDIATDGRIATDLLGSLWILPRHGGRAQPVDGAQLPVQRPRWSPDGTTLLYQARISNQQQLWLHSLERQSAELVSVGDDFDQHPDWHPDGSRIVYSSARRESGFDLWELDLPTRLTWRISDLDGDETEPVWSADGRDLAYIHRDDAGWSLMLRRHGEPDRILERATERLSSPSWRPDGSLISFLRHAEEGLSVEIAILSDPPLVRTLITDGDVFDAPVAWTDRQQLLYTANGAIRQRRFDSWESTDVPFRAAVRQPAAMRSAAARQPRELPSAGAPAGRLVLRVRRFFDGTGAAYREGLDIVIEGDRIGAIEARRARHDSIVVDMRDLTALPGYIDAYAELPRDAGEALGPVLLSSGVTTMLVLHPASAELNRRWSGKTLPGPRLLPMARTEAPTGADLPWLVTLAGTPATDIVQPAGVARWQRLGIPVVAANWQRGLGSGARMLLGAGTLPTSPGGRRYADLELAGRFGPLTLVSGLADANTTGLASILASRQAALAGNGVAATRRFASRPRLSAGASVIAGSKPNGLPPGIGLQAELLALVDAGFSPAEALRAAGSNAAAAIGLDAALGHIRVGSAADLVLVDGDPLGDIRDALNVVAVLRNGRFFSAIGLIERAGTGSSVE